MLEPKLWVTGLGWNTKRVHTVGGKQMHDMTNMRDPACVCCSNTCLNPDAVTCTTLKYSKGLQHRHEGCCMHACMDREQHCRVQGTCMLLGLAAGGADLQPSMKPSMLPLLSSVHHGLQNVGQQ